MDVEVNDTGEEICCHQTFIKMNFSFKYYCLIIMLALENELRITRFTNMFSLLCDTL